MGKVIITVKSLITPEAYEKLEDALRDCLEDFGVSAAIDDRETGNTLEVGSMDGMNIMRWVKK